MKELLEKRNRKKFSITVLTDMFKIFDLHGSEISVNFDGKTRYRTHLGSICTIGTFLTVFILISLRQQSITSAEPI